MSLLHFLLINLFLAVFYLVYLILEKGKSHFNFNRAFLIIAPIVSFTLPFLFEITTDTPMWRTVLPTIEVLQDNNILSGSSNYNWKDGLLLFGFLVSIGLIINKLLNISRRSKNDFYKSYRGAKVYLLTNSHESYSFFNKIYLNSSSIENEEIVLLHEYAHYKEFHSIDVVYFSLLKGLLWFNPIVYLWIKKAKENHEFIADNYVLKQDVSGKEYGTILLASALGVQSPVIVNAFNVKSTIRKRLEKFNHKNQYNMKQLILVPVLAGMTFMSMSLNQKQLPIQQTEQSKEHEVDVEASFPGGVDAFFAFVAKNFEYPQSSIESNSQGKVYVQFTVMKDGSLSGFKVARGVKDAALNESAIALVKKMPNWVPAQKDGENVKSQMTLPINFTLN